MELDQEREARIAAEREATRLAGRMEEIERQRRLFWKRLAGWE